MTSTIKVDNIQDQDGNNIINENSNTITIGASGDTVTLASGASQTGFGRTGTVDWQTGSIKTATFTAANGEGYFANTSGGSFTMNLPAGTAGNIVSVVDYTNTFQTNSLTITPNGSQKIGGVAASFIASTEGQSLTFVYVDDTEGWKNVQDSTSNATGNPFLQATGGTITTCGNCKIHTFTGPGTFTVCAVSANCAAENVVSYMVIAGGGSGGGGSGLGGGGGAGGYREVKTPLTPYTASPLDGYSTPGNRITVTAQAYPITVGAGGASVSSNNEGNNGNPSTFSTITSTGGGGGGGEPNTPALNGAAGGSGGGGGENSGNTGTGGAGNTPPVSPAQGRSGGSGANFPSPNSSGGGGGGGATSDGGNASAPSGAGGGGDGATTSINGTPTTRGGGGGGSGYGPGNPTSFAGNPGPGGGGRGAFGPDSGNTLAIAGTANTGGGGGGGVATSPAEGTGAAGGSGIVIIRYKYQ